MAEISVDKVSYDCFRINYLVTDKNRKHIAVQADAGKRVPVKYVESSVSYKERQTLVIEDLKLGRKYRLKIFWKDASRNVFKEDRLDDIKTGIHY